VNAAVADIAAAAGTLDAVLTQGGALLSTGQGLLTAIDPATINLVFDRVGAVAAEVAAITGAVDPASVRSIVADIATFATDLAASGPLLSAVLGDARDVMAEVETFAAAIGASSDDVTAILAGGRDLVDRLTGLAAAAAPFVETLDRVVANEGAQLMADATAALAAIRDVADTIDAGLPAIIADVQRFADRGLPDLEALISEARQAIRSLDLVLNMLERQPQSLIFGGSGAPEFNRQ
jgi:phospholipid/cholesterol/gamma-HCH transport system substrate-binding protein